MSTQTTEAPPRASEQAKGLFEALQRGQSEPEKPHSVWLKSGLSVIRAVGVIVGIIVLFGLFWGIAKDVSKFGTIH